MSKFPAQFDPAVQVEDADLGDEGIVVDGERLTEARASEIADGLERRRANLVPGGKSLSGEGKHSPTVQFRVPEAMRERLERQAKEEGVTPSRLARKALERYLALSQ